MPSEMVSARLTGGGSGRKGRAAPDQAWSVSQLLGRPRQQRRGALLGLAGECPTARRPSRTQVTKPVHRSGQKRPSPQARKTSGSPAPVDVRARPQAPPRTSSPSSPPPPPGFLRLPLSSPSAGFRL